MSPPDPGDPSDPSDPSDPFGTDALRRRVLDAWTASPARFREDANAEEDYALGGYRDRLVVELAQNAADAAVRAGSPGRLLLRLAPDPQAPAGLALLAANTGAPLDPEGVQALATLRASAKRDDDGGATVGRFGVGFAAVLDVTDEPALRSTSGGARWSRTATAAEVTSVPVLAEEAARRGGHVPVLRMPWPDPLPPPTGYDSVVVLPLRDDAAVARVRSALAEVDEALLLMLPALGEVEVDDGSGPPRTARAADLRVRRLDVSGRLDPTLLADRPAEERRSTRWSVGWAHPRPAGTRAVLHAPTPTDEPVGLPALLVASFPLEPSRRHVAPGPLRDFLVGRAAQAYADLVRAVAADGGDVDEVLVLVPGPVAEGSLDADLRQAVLALLPSVPMLAGGLRPDSALAVDGLPAAAAALLDDAVPGLLPAAWAGRRELDRLGVRRTRLADLVDDLAALDRAPAWWAGLHEAMAGADREALTGLPVPLADGRIVRGPRGVVVGADADLARALQLLGARVADPAVGARPEAHDLLVRLGAVPTDPASLLDHASVRAAVESSADADRPGEVADAVLHLVRGSGRSVRELPWLARLTLPDDEGGWSEAGELVLPGSALEAVLRPGTLGRPDQGLLEGWGADALTDVGVLAGFALVTDEDVALDPDACDHDLDAEDGWLDDVLEGLEGAADPGALADLPPVLPAYAAVRDLDLVAEDRWPEALRLIAGDPGLRAAVVQPAVVLLEDGRRVDAEPYAAWWLRTHPVLGGRRPDGLRAPGTAALAGLLDEAPDVGVDPAFLRALGVATSVAEVAASPMVLPLLAAGADPDRARPDGPGERRPVPAVAGRVLTGPAATYVEHDDLTVAGVACEWWVDDAGDVHAATLEGLARGLAWSAGAWDRRLLLAAVLAEPDRADDLLAEESWT